MPKYMTQFTYSRKSVAGMLEKPENRSAAAERLFGAAGGTIECMYYSFGDYDGVVISDFPSDIDAASALLTAGASGAFSALKTSVLIPMEDGATAMKKAQDVAASYSPPGN